MAAKETVVALVMVSDGRNGVRNLPSVRQAEGLLPARVTVTQDGFRYAN
jgi:hypothetical protein